MKPILEIKNISKRFKIGEQIQPYVSLRDSLSNLFSRKRGDKDASEFWALRDVSFNVNQGDTLAIIGRNGAGKSTLLKILSKITPPTEGEIIARGRIASLLEVGTGFHPELTGRENIYLNGSILGLNRKEINSKFNEIVEFSEITSFLDTPLKHYSSGMQLRLAFAVAANLDPEILVIDEVLAVGDSVFQQKCIQKMTEVSRSGRTILFVSHNFSAIRALCKSAVVLQKGVKVFEGDVEESIEFYNSEAKMKGKEIELGGILRTKYSRELIFDRITFENESIDFGYPIRFSIKLKTPVGEGSFSDLDFGIAIYDKNNNCLIHISNRFLNINFNHDNDNIFYEFEIDNILKPGVYNLTLFLRSHEKIQDWLADIIQIEVNDGNPYDFPNTSAIQGSIFPLFQIKKIFATNETIV